MMALFGNKNNNGNSSESNSKIFEEAKKREELKKQYEELCDRISKINGSLVKAQGNGFEENVTYKFYIENDNYFFLRNYEKNYYMLKEDNDYEKALATKPIILSHNEYECELINNETQVEYSKEYDGIARYKIEPIPINFKNKIDSSKDITIYVNNDKKNIEPLFEFYENIGIKNFFNIVNFSGTDIFGLSLEKCARNGFIRNASYDIWRENKNLYFVNRYQNYIEVTTVPTDEILYYRSEGELRYEQQISGGGGMGINYGSAVVGGLLFGTAGATIGSRRNEEIKQIESKTVTHDNRKVLLMIKRNGIIYKIECLMGG